MRRDDFVARATRYVFATLSALSLLLCVAACVLWVRSYFASGVVNFTQPRERRIWYGVTGKGRAALALLTDCPSDANPAGLQWHAETASPLKARKGAVFDRLGFGAERAQLVLDSGLIRARSCSRCGLPPARAPSCPLSR
jgi:hypothetical protein